MFGSNLLGGVVCRETHADGGVHYHAAIFGNFQKRGAMLRSFNSRSSQWGCDAGVNLPVGGNRIQFAHTNPKNVPWPFLGPKSMLEYLTVSSAKKNVDANPYWFTVCDGDTTDVEQVDQDTVEDAYKIAFPARVGLMGRAAIVEAMAEDGTPEAEVIKVIMADTTRENAHEFAMLIRLFNVTARITEPAELPQFIARAWQQLVLDWMVMPLDKKDNNKRGLWMHCPPNSGKSTLITMLKSLVGVDNVFIPAERTETYNTQSMNGYTGQAIIALDDTRGYTNDTGSTVHKASFIKFIKAIASGDDMVYTMYNKVHRYQPFARILITSNYPMPVVNEEDENIALRRRYIELKSIEVDEVARDLGLPRDLAAAGGQLVGVLAAAHPPPHFGAQMPLECVDLCTPPQSPHGGDPPLLNSGNPAPRTRRRIASVDYNEQSNSDARVLDYGSDGHEETKDSQMSDI